MPSSDKYSLLGRFINLLFLLNASLFITSRLSVTRGYWFCYLSAVAFLTAYGIMLFPLTNLRSRRVYTVVFTLTAVGAYFTLASVLYWLQHDAQLPLTP